MKSVPPPAPPTGPLINPGEPPAVERVNPDGAAPLLLICDHASNRVPRSLNGLGIDPAQLRRHIAWDIGAGAVARGLAERLNAPALLAGYSRLAIDCNRAPDDPQSIPEKSDGTPIPANLGLGPADRQARVEALFLPYHAAIAADIDRLRRRGPVPVLFSVHSFTTSLNGQARPWDAGVLWNRDPRVAVPLIAALSADRSLCIGDNLPYSGRELAYSLNRHGGAAGLPNCAIEIRQDRVADAPGVAEWIDRLADALKEILAVDGLHRVAAY